MAAAVDTSGAGATLEETVSIVVGDRTFRVAPTLFASHPDTMLGALFSERTSSMLRRSSDALAFERQDPSVFAAVLKFYSTGELPLDAPPPGISERVWFRDLDYWCIFPELPGPVTEAAEDAFRAHVALLLEALHSARAGYLLERLRTGYHRTVRFVTPTCV